MREVPAMRRLVRADPDDRWAVVFGRIAVYSFAVALVSGILLLPFFRPIMTPVVYHGSYRKLDGLVMSRAYQSVLGISFDVRGGLLIRQVHHWSADLFVAAVCLRLIRVFFRGRFRRSHWLIWIGLLLAGMLAGFSGAILPDDMLSGGSLSVFTGVILSLPLVGTHLIVLIFGGWSLPGQVIIPRDYWVHIIVLPAVLGGLLLLSFRSDRPRAVLRRIDPLLPFTAAVLVMLGAAAQINPVWLYGPYQPGSISAGSVPDWYMGFLDGALRVMPALELSVGGHPLSLDVLIPAVIVPGLFFTVVAAYPLLDGWIAGGWPPRGLLPPRPADPANRTAVGVAGITLYGLLWAAAANDEIAYHLHVSLYAVTWAFRILVLTGPVLAFALTRMICHAAQARRQDEAEHGVETGRVVMTPEGGYTEIREPAVPRLCPFGGADDGPGTEQDGGDRFVAGHRELRLPGRGQVVGQQPPGLLGVHGQARREAAAGLVTELPAGPVGYQVPSPGERPGNRDRHGVSWLCRRPGQAVGIGPTQAVEHRPGEVGTQVTGTVERLEDLLLICGPAHATRSATRRGLRRRAARARRGTFPVGGLQAGQQLDQPAALDSEQAGVVPGSLGGQHPSIMAGR